MMIRFRIAVAVAAITMVLNLPAEASAQSISGGVRADVAVASFQNADFSTDPRIGLRAGVFADLGLSGAFGIRAEAVYSMKGVKSADSSSDVTVKLDYIEVPIMVKVAVGSSPGLFIVTGPAVGIKISSKLTSDSESIDYGEQVHPLDVGWVAGLGVETSLGGTSVFLDARYTMGLRSVFDFGDPSDSDSDDKNQVFSAGVGIGLRRLVNRRWCTRRCGSSVSKLFSLDMITYLWTRWLTTSTTPYQGAAALPGNSEKMSQATTGTGETPATPVSQSVRTKQLLAS